MPVRTGDAVYSVRCFVVDGLKLDLVLGTEFLYEPRAVLGVFHGLLVHGVERRVATPVRVQIKGARDVRRG